MIAAMNVAAGAALALAAVAAARPPPLRREGTVIAAAALAWFLGAVPALALVHRPLLVLAVVAWPRLSAVGFPARAAIVVATVGVVPAIGSLPMVAVTLGLLVVTSGVTRPRDGALASIVFGLAISGAGVARAIAPVGAHATAIEIVYDSAVIATALVLAAGARRLSAGDRVVDRLVELVPGAEQLPAFAADPDIADAVATATRLLDTNAELQAELDGHVAAVRRSRRRLVEVNDDERRRLQQRLDAPKTCIDDLAATFGRVAAGADVDTRRQIERLQGELVGLRDDLGRLGQGLHPRRLEEQGLRAALVELASRATITTAVFAPTERLPRSVETTLWYVCAEAVANAGKHARARRIDIVVEVDPTLRAASAVVRDDGTGGADVAAGRGLAGLVDRVDAVGGSIDIGVAAAGGTEIRVVVPL